MSVVENHSFQVQTLSLEIGNDVYCGLKGNSRQKISIFYLHFRQCTINGFNFFLAYPSFFHLQKCFYSDFGPSALQLRMEESVAIFAVQLMTYEYMYGVDM